MCWRYDAEARRFRTPVDGCLSMLIASQAPPTKQARAINLLTTLFQTQATDNALIGLGHERCCGVDLLGDCRPVGHSARHCLGFVRQESSGVWNNAPTIVRPGD